MMGRLKNLPLKLKKWTKMQSGKRQHSKGCLRSDRRWSSNNRWQNRDPKGNHSLNNGP